MDGKEEITVADSDLQIRRGVWGRGRGWSPKKFFFGFRASVWSKNKGGGPPGPSPRAATELLKQAARNKKF